MRQQQSLHCREACDSRLSGGWTEHEPQQEESPRSCGGMEKLVPEKLVPATPPQHARVPADVPLPHCPSLALKHLAELGLGAASASIPRGVSLKGRHSSSGEERPSADAMATGEELLRRERQTSRLLQRQLETATAELDCSLAHNRRLQEELMARGRLDDQLRELRRLTEGLQQQLASERSHSWELRQELDKERLERELLEQRLSSQADLTARLEAEAEGLSAKLKDALQFTELTDFQAATEKACLVSEALAKRLDEVSPRFSSRMEQNSLLREEFAKVWEQDCLLREEFAKVAQERDDLARSLRQECERTDRLQEEIADMAYKNTRAADSFDRVAEQLMMPDSSGRALEVTSHPKQRELDLMSWRLERGTAAAQAALRMNDASGGGFSSEEDGEFPALAEARRKLDGIRHWIRGADTKTCRLVLSIREPLLQEPVAVPQEPQRSRSLKTPRSTSGKRRCQQASETPEDPKSSLQKSALGKILGLDPTAAEEAICKHLCRVSPSLRDTSTECA